MSGRGHFRTFAALDPPAGLAEELAAWARSQRAGAEGMRVLPPDSLHLTLAFLGERSADQLDLIVDAMALAAAESGGVQELALAGPLLLPPRRPRVLAAAIDDSTGELSALQSALAAQLRAAIGWTDPRAFRPHITLARFGRGGRPPIELSAVPPGRFSADEIVLYRSHLEQAGARYEALERIALR